MESQSAFLIAMAIIFLSVIVTILIVIFAVRKSRSTKKFIIDDLLQPFNAVRRKGLQNIYDGDHNGHKLRILYFQGAKNQPPYLKVFYPIPFDKKVIIKKESSFESFAKRIGLTKELQTGDKSFDDKYFINTGSDEFARLFLSDRKKREQIDDILDNEGLKVSSIEMKKGEISINIPLARTRIDKLDRAQLERCAGLLHALTEDMPSGSAGFEMPGLEKSRKKTVVMLYASAIAIDAAGLFMLIYGLINYKLVDGSLFLDSFKYSLPLILLFWIFIIPLIKGRSDSHTIAIVLLAITIPGFILGTMGFLVFTNGYMDQSDVHYYNAVVQDKYITTNKNSKSYHITVNNWNNPEKHIKLSVSSSDYEDYDNGDSVNIRTKKGYWGYEWIISYNRADRAEYEY